MSGEELSNGGTSPPATPGSRLDRDRRPGWLRIRENVPSWLQWALGSLPVAALLGIWWAVTAGATPESRLISPTILPSPSEVVASFPSLWFDRALTRNLAVSLGRVVSGFAAGVAIAFPLGLLMGSFSKVKAMFNPVSVFGAYLPIPALVPLTMSLFGTGERQKVAFLGLAFVIYLLPLVVQAVEAVDDLLLKTAYTLGAEHRAGGAQGAAGGVVAGDLPGPADGIRHRLVATSCSPRWSTSGTASAGSSSSPSGAVPASTSTSSWW